jgi:hypothetical protein
MELTGLEPATCSGRRKEAARLEVPICSTFLWLVDGCGAADCRGSPTILVASGTGGLQCLANPARASGGRNTA